MSDIDKYDAMNPGLDPGNKILKSKCGNCGNGPEYQQVPSCSDEKEFSSVKPDSTQSPNAN